MEIWKQTTLITADYFWDGQKKERKNYWRISVIMCRKEI